MLPSEDSLRRPWSRGHFSVTPGQLHSRSERANSVTGSSFLHSTEPDTHFMPHLERYAYSLRRRFSRDVVSVTSRVRMHSSSVEHVIDGLDVGDLALELLLGLIPDPLLLPQTASAFHERRVAGDWSAKHTRRKWDGYLRQWLHLVCQDSSVAALVHGNTVYKGRGSVLRL